MAGLRELLRVPEGSAAALASVDTRSTPGLPHRRADKSWARRELARIGADLATGQEQLYAQAKVAGDQRRVLLVLQAMDCGGKDGATRRVAGMMNPQGLHVVVVRQADPGGAGARFPVADPGRLPAAGLRRGVQPVALRGRADRPGARPGTAGGVAGPVRQDQRALSANWPTTACTILKVMLHISYAEQGDRLARPAGRPDEALEVQPGRPGRACLLGASTRPPTPTRSAAVRPRPRRGTWCPPTASGTATGRWPRCWRRRSPGLELSYPPGDFDPEEQRARLAAP